MLKNLILLALVGVAFATKCNRTIYSGFPCCQGKMLDAKESCETALSSFKGFCPDPKFKPPNDLSEDAMIPSPPGAPDGHVNFLVYRAASSQDKYATVLANSNAADRAGVLSYIHSEVVPEDMRFKENRDGYTRKFNIDSIMIFNVTVYNPKDTWLTPKIPLSPYVAFDAGKCNPQDPGCDAYQTKGWTVGYQVQQGNIRAKYSNDLLSNYWYSFPKDGLCDTPNATKTCTYKYNVVGRVVIDEMIGLDHLGYKNVYDFFKAGNIEFSRAAQSSAPGCCQTTGGIDFWNSPCDLDQSFSRIQRLINTPTRGINDTKFYNMTQDCQSSGSGLTTGELIAIIAGGIVVLAIGVYVGVYMMKSKNPQERQPLMGGDTAPTTTGQV